MYDRRQVLCNISQLVRSVGRAAATAAVGSSPIEPPCLPVSTARFSRNTLVPSSPSQS